MANKMKAIRIHEFGGIDKLTFENDVSIPIIRKDKILIKVHAAGVNPVDTYYREGAFSNLPTLPFIPGMDGAGVVEQIGDDLLEKFRIGQRVFFTYPVEGSYAEYVLATEKCCWPLPDHLSFEQGASLGIPYLTAYRALFQKARAKPGQTVLVHGASGAVGLAACQLAKVHGLTVFGTTGTDAGQAVVKKSGQADFTFNHNEKDHMDQIRAKTVNGQGVNIILEMLADVNLSHDLPLLKQNGIVVVVGCRDQVQIDPRNLMTVESSIMGVALFHSSEADWEENASEISQLLNKKLLTPIVAETYPLKDTYVAHREVIEHKAGSKGKLVLRIC